MIRELAPDGVARPAAAYALATAVERPSLIVHTSGIVGTRADGSTPVSLAEQATVVWQSIATLLCDAGLGLSDVASYTTYVVDGEDLGVVMAARDAALDGHRAASTLIVVPRLARPEWKLEVAVVAAR